MTQVDTEDPPEGSSARVTGLVNTAHSEFSRIRLKAVLVAAGLIAGFFVVVGLVLYFKPFSHTATVEDPTLDVFAAGPEDAFPAGTITYFEDEHFHLVRLEDGTFLALYDLGPLNQMKLAAGEEEQARCRTVVRDDAIMVAWLGGAAAPAGFEAIGFYDECEGVAWTVEGDYISGPESGKLDRFPVTVLEEIVRVDVANRRCVNEIGPRSPCIETQ